MSSQSLQALEKISFEHPTAVLRAGGLLAVLSYLDFFSTGVQVRWTATISTGLPSCQNVCWCHSTLQTLPVPCPCIFLFPCEAR